MSTSPFHTGKNAPRNYRIGTRCFLAAFIFIYVVVFEGLLVAIRGGSERRDDEDSSD
jgi:hypothetical protein